jgi:hypothetical protein
MSRASHALVLAALACLGLPAGAHAAVTLSAPTIVVPAGTTGSVSASVAGPGPAAVGELRLAPITSAASPGGSWVSVAPFSVGPLSPPVSAPFTVLVAVPAGTRPGTYATQLTATADGAGAGSVTLEVQVPALDFSLSGARLAGRWSQSRFSGSLSLRGQVGAPAAIDLQLTREAPHARPLRLTTSAQQGPFTSTIAGLPATLAPGRYRLQAVAHGNGQDTTVERQIVLGGPPEGVVDLAAASGGRNGLPAATLPGVRYALWVRFHFAARPRSGTVSVTFYPPGGSPAVIQKPVAETVAADVTAGPPAGLPHGRWRVVLRAGTTVIRELSVVIGG